MATKLPKAVLTDLARSGLTADDAARMGVFYVPGPEAAQLLGTVAAPSFGKAAAKPRDLPACYALPYLDQAGQPTNYVRLRLLGRHYNSEGKLVRYLQPVGSKPRLYYPAPLFDAPLQDKTSDGRRAKAPPLWFTEGEKKAYALAKLGLKAVGLGGVDAWKAHEDGHEVSLPLADLDSLEIKGREVLIVFDADIRWKPSVRLALLKFARYLLDRGAIPREVEIPEGLGKGVDDAVVALGGYTPAVAEQLAAWQRRDLEPELELSVPRATVTSQPVSSIAKGKLAWLWPGRFAKGCLSLVAGDPSLGKSTMTLDLAARVTRGEPWPDGEKNEAGDVVLLSAEDDPVYTLRPRLEAAGADLTRVHLISSVVEEVVENGKTRRVFNIGADAVEIERLLLRLPNPRLVIIDPISSYLGDADGHVNTEVRAALVPLMETLQRRRASGLLVTHLTKGDTAAIYRVMGSLAFVAAARAVYLVMRDPEDPERRLLLPAKNNLAPLGKGLAYTIGGPVGSPKLAWEDDPVELTPDEVIALGKEGNKAAKKNKAVTWLAQALVGGMQKASVLEKRAEEELGISKDTLKRAKQELGVEAVRQGGAAGDGSWWWRLPELPEKKF